MSNWNGVFSFFLVVCVAEGAGFAYGDRAAERAHMIRTQIEARGLQDPRVLEAMRNVRRHLFVPAKSRRSAYGDYPLSIGYDQTISQPYIVAVMTELLHPQPNDKVLEVGTGSGYQAAILSRLVDKVITIEIIEPLGERSRALLTELGYNNVKVITGDGYNGRPEEAPYDAIIVTAAPERVPEPLLEQLKVGGRMVIPVGGFYQELKVIVRTSEGFETKKVFPVRFVPMTGEVQNKLSKRRKHYEYLDGIEF